jgi:hypothetical protein
MSKNLRQARENFRLAKKEYDFAMEMIPDGVEFDGYVKRLRDAENALTEAESIEDAEIEKEESEF